MVRNDYVFVTDDGKVYTLSGTRLDRRTGKPIYGAPKLNMAGLKTPKGHGKRLDSTKRKNTLDSNKRHGRGAPKVTGKVTVTSLKDMGANAYVAEGMLKCNFPQEATQCNSRFTITRTSRDQAKTEGNGFKNFLTRNIENYVRGAGGWRIS